MSENCNLMHSTKISVLMSIYNKETASNLEQCFESLLNQTIPANEWVIVKDGPLTSELEFVLHKYEKLYPTLIKYVIFEKNKGLGIALREGVIACSNEIIARMDTDDICRQDRFELELKEFINDPSLDIVGSHIKEFDQNINNIISVRKVPLENNEIIKYQKRRSAYNHMTVMFKRRSILKAGNYEHAPLMEDDMLWTRLILAGCKGKNIDDYLVFARTGKAMISRRGSFSYFLKYKKSRRKVYKLGLASYSDYLYTVLIQFFISLMPLKLRQVVFIKILRRNK
ncbi:glycosyltransferase [Merdibacter massiliensis]|uniref:glycosyltransferase n=1 Tax=Merdibacter massiliensis TaxID=1871030 RepID=UPI001F173E85|nr:glycosyltransferase [Merdibacter massiliensis]